MMDPKRDGPSMMLAPSARGGAALSFPPADPPRKLPPVDQHVVAPETTRDEMIRGRKIIAQPALEPHGDAHANLGAVIRLHVREGYRASIDLLTRVSERSNFATDLSIRRDGTDPATGRRHLEEVSFEIVNEQAPGVVREKAEDLIERGVRRVFAIQVKRGEICEWSREKVAFVPLDLDGRIEDPCFIRPIRVRALLDGAVAEREAARALERKGNPEILAIKQDAEEKGREEGREEGRREMLLEVLRERFGEIPEAMLARVATASGATLSRWAKRSYAASSLDDVFVEVQEDSGPVRR
ncbi:hypothetical protein [Polyangium fumosum]|uniref:Uncharacterized protein n=1 Tax=Polyangium fumosum TaxID=889272 RepID=A0A4U1IX69_9BACT|nr:hypothetical protein [Polyangium fumosum]TKC99130.1 hypothetical protein E8A74_39020 [Polyangium fumosum]